MRKKTEDTLDKLIIHLAQSQSYIKTRKLENTLGWRIKIDKPTQEDLKSIIWALKFIRRHFGKFLVPK